MKLFQLIGAMVSCVAKVSFAILKLILTIVVAPFCLLRNVPFWLAARKLKKTDKEYENNDFYADDYYEKLRRMYGR